MAGHHGRALGLKPGTGTFPVHTSARRCAPHQWTMTWQSGATRGAGGPQLALVRRLWAPRPWAGLGLEIIAAFLVLIIRAPVDVLVPLLQQWDVLRAVDVGFFYLDENPAFRVAPTGGLGRGDHLWCHVWPREEILIRHDVGLPVTCRSTVL